MTIKISGRKLVVAGLVAVLAIVIGVVVLSRGGDGKNADADPNTDSAKSAPPEGALAEWWHTDKMPDWADEGTVSRMWAIDDTVVTVTTGGVWGFDAKTGKRKWELDAPSGRNVPCGASPTLNKDGAAVVLYGDSPTRCGDDLVVFDTGSGEVLWDKELSDFSASVDPPQLSIGDKVVTASFDDGGYFGGKHYRFSIDGEKLPLLAVPGGQDCPEETRRVQSQVYTLVDSVCDSQLVAFDTQSGKRRWARSSEGTSIPGDIVTDSPLTVSGLVGGGKSLETFSAKGKKLADIKLPDGIRDRPHVIDDSVLITEVGGDDKVFIAVNLKNGKEVWRDTSFDGAMAVGTDDDQLLVLARFDDNTQKYIPKGYNCRLVALDPLDDDQTDEGILPCAGAEVKNGLIYDALTTDEALYIVAAPDGDSAPRLTAYKRPQ